jgi:hypothetical protein
MSKINNENTYDAQNQNRMTNKINNGGTKSVPGAEGSASTSKFMNTNDHRLFQETNLALEKSNKLLNIFDYIETVNFKMDTFMLNKFWQCIAENSCVSKKLISYLKNQFKK